MKTFFQLIADEAALSWITTQANKPEAEAQAIVQGWRQQARQMGIPDSVCLHAMVQAGCTFKEDIPQLGPTWEDFQYLQNWDFPDPPTENSLVSWIPRPLLGSTSQDVNQQKVLIQEFKANTGLPPRYELSFGSVNHLAGMSLAHFQATDKDPFYGLVVRTDTFGSTGCRLRLGWLQGRLDCDWLWGDEGHPDMAVFVLGVIRSLGH